VQIYSLFLAVSQIEVDCVECIERGWGFRFFKSLAFSPIEYSCLNNSKKLPIGSVIVDVARTKEQCQDIDVRLPSREMTENDLADANLIDDVFIMLGNTTGHYYCRENDIWFYMPCISK